VIMKMNRAVLGGIVLLLIETGVVPWLVPAAWSDRLVPHLTFILTLYVACFAGRHWAFLFGLGFGLLGDLLYYGNLIGPYGFGMGLVGYAAGLALERRMPTFASVIGVTAIGSLGLNTIVFLIYRLFRLTQWSYGFAFYWYMVPSLLLEIFVALILYLPVRRLLFRQSASSGEESPG
jgi:rod shape-determining protein MreD